MNVFYTINEAVLAVGLFLLLLAATEAGFHLGRRAKSKVDEKTKSQIPVIQGSVLGVLGLLLGFTISMAVSRFETRKQLVLEEANAISTSYLRAALLPEPDRSYITGRLRDYLDLRVELARTRKDVSTSHDQIRRLQNDVWTRAVAQAERDPNPVKTGLLLQSLNQMIDLDAARWMALNNHVPETVVYENAFVALLATTLVGYSFGVVGGKRHLFSVMLLTVAIAVTLLVIIDLDSARRGLIVVTQQPLVDLQHVLPKSGSGFSAGLHN
ncbi:MAG TPA: hypothetical protein VFP91_08795 [Vicinamibacterales bacterium]|nr:hypothetical protein [Vicinamibacterales bacterium]